MAQKKQTVSTETPAPTGDLSPLANNTGKAPAKKKPTKKASDTTIAAKPDNAVSQPATSASPAESGSNGSKNQAAAKPTDAPAQKTAPAPKKKAAPKAASVAAPKTAPAQSTEVTKVYGEIQASNNTYFIHKGSVPEGQLQLVPQKNKEELLSRMPSYSGQFVTILGVFANKKKTDKFATFTIQSIASHDEVARKAYELSQDNPNSVEDNWFRAENELLKQ